MPISDRSDFTTRIWFFSGFWKYERLYLKNVTVDEHMVINLFNHASYVEFIDCNFVATLYLAGLVLAFYGENTTGKIVIRAVKQAHFCNIPQEIVEYVSAECVSLETHIPLSVLDKSSVQELYMMLDFDELDLTGFDKLESIIVQATNNIVNVPETCSVYLLEE